MGLFGVFGIAGCHLDTCEAFFPASWQILGWHLLTACLWLQQPCKDASLKPIYLRPT